MSSTQIYREANRRSHKLLGLYLSIWAWTRHVECVVVERGPLLSYLDLGAMRGDRIRNFCSNVATLFPYSDAIFRSSDGLYSYMYLSRSPFPTGFPWGSLTATQRIRKLRSTGLPSAVAPIPDETVIVRLLAEMSHGICDFPHGRKPKK